MSANNWGVCPKCHKLKQGMHVKKIEKQYGKIGLDEYRGELKAAVLKDKEFEKNKYTLREDYGIGVDDMGFFESTYSGKCQKCGYEYHFTHGVQTDIS